MRVRAQQHAEKTGRYMERDDTYPAAGAGGLLRRTRRALTRTLPQPGLVVRLKVLCPMLAACLQCLRQVTP